MRYLLLIPIILLFTKISLSCSFINSKNTENTNKLMGKKSKFYDTYKQGKCLLEEALKPLPQEQRKIIAKLIAKSYTFEN